ncbi:hypothetical protein KJ590_02925 [Patescibacteria group bacterium]|nr:hypothetical protein [Patescibacteria group bacterium]MBU4142930.1 hypothetical protein [Patescibacteria group bacterium]
MSFFIVEANLRKSVNAILRYYASLRQPLSATFTPIGILYSVYFIWRELVFLRFLASIVYHKIAFWQAPTPNKDSAEGARSDNLVACC